MYKSTAISSITMKGLQDQSKSNYYMYMSRVKSSNSQQRMNREETATLFPVQTISSTVATKAMQWQ